MPEIQTLIETYKQVPIIFFIIVFTPMLAASLFYGIGYSALERFVDPVFDYRFKRLAELSAGFFIASLIMSMYLDVISSHFHVDIERLDQADKIAIPCLFLVVVRCIVKFHSSRIARDHINMVMFLILVSGAASLAVTIIRAINGYNDAQIFHFPDNHFFIKLLILSAIIPFTTDTILIQSKKFYFVKKYLIKDKKLIDLTEELPITFEFISGEDNINNKIKELIYDGSEHSCQNRPLFIMTKTYTTITNNIDAISQRCNYGGIKIIGPYANDDSIIASRIKSIEERGVLVCKESYDDIRTVIDGDHRLIASFATSGNKGSHVGVYSEHPFIISMFKSYFTTKCRKKGPCNAECNYISRESSNLKVKN